jgi:hypothetical protein
MDSFSNGGAWVGSFVFTFVFVVIGCVMQLGREKEGGDSLAQMDRKQALLRSLQPGFQWGSEMFLMSGVNYGEPSLAAGMALFRILHAILAVIIMVCIFDPYEIAHHFDPLIHDISKLGKRYNQAFAGANNFLVAAVFVTSLLDVTMIQYLPWKAPNDVFQETQGFPTFSLMQWCLGVKITQSFVSVCSQIAFLGSKSNSDDPAMSSQGVGLFVMNILCATAGIVASAVMLIWKDKILRTIDARMRKEDSKQLRNFNVGRRSANDVGTFGDVYGEREDGLSFGDNPMLSEATFSSTTAVAGDKDEGSVGGDVEAGKLGVGEKGEDPHGKPGEDPDPFGHGQFGADSDADTVDGDSDPDAKDGSPWRTSFSASADSAVAVRRGSVNVQESESPSKESPVAENGLA